MKTLKKPKHKLYDAAYTLFVEQGMTCAAIADTLSLREPTLSEWRTAMQWDEARKRILSAPDTIRRLLLEQMEKVSSGEKVTIDTDALSKIAKALTYFDGKVPLTVVYSVIKEFDLFMAEVAPHKAFEFTEYHKMFLHRRAQLDSMK